MHVNRVNLTNSVHWRRKLGGEVFNNSGVSLLNEVFNLRFQNIDVTVGGVCNIGVVNSKRWHFRGINGN